MITIVSGLPRSGTSMMMRILDAGGLPVLMDSARAADEDNPNGYYEFAPVLATREDPSWLKQAEGRVVKMVYKLLYDLPAGYAYRVLFMQRALKEVVASQNRMLRRLGRMPANVDGGSTLDDHALVGGLAAEIAAARDWLRRRPDFQVLYVNYNQLLAAPQEHVARVNTFLGGQWNEAAMRQVVDPKLYRERMS
jgi:hypothetical protein